MVCETVKKRFHYSCIRVLGHHRWEVELLASCAHRYCRWAAAILAIMLIFSCVANSAAGVISPSFSLSGSSVQRYNFPALRSSSSFSISHIRVFYCICISFQGVLRQELKCESAFIIVLCRVPPYTVGSPSPSNFLQYHFQRLTILPCLFSSVVSSVRGIIEANAHYHISNSKGWFHHLRLLWTPSQPMSLNFCWCLDAYQHGIPSVLSVIQPFQRHHCDQYYVSAEHAICSHRPF